MTSKPLCCAVDPRWASGSTERAHTRQKYISPGHTGYKHAFDLTDGFRVSCLLAASVATAHTMWVTNFECRLRSEIDLFGIGVTPLTQGVVMTTRGPWSANCRECPPPLSDEPMGI